LSDRNRLLEGRATGPIEVVKAVHDVRQGGFYGIATHIQPMTEARAIRPWEDFNENIRRFFCAINVAAVPAEISAAYISLSDSAAPGTIICFDRALGYPTGASLATLRTPARAAARATYATSILNVVLPADTRWGLNVDQQLEAFSGSDPGAIGGQIGFSYVAGNIVTVFQQPIIIGVPKGGNDPLALVISGTVANQSITCEFYGRVITPRQ